MMTVQEIELSLSDALRYGWDEFSGVLDEREKKIIRLRFGLDDQDPMTLHAVGLQLGVQRERIRQIQNIALSKIRRCLREHCEAKA